MVENRPDEDGAFLYDEDEENFINADVLDRPHLFYGAGKKHLDLQVKVHTPGPQVKVLPRCFWSQVLKLTGSCPIIINSLNQWF